MNRPQVRVRVVCVVLGLAACTSVGVVGHPTEYVSTRAPSRVWVTQSDKTVVELFKPLIKGDNSDTLAGFTKSGDYVAMPMANVQIMKAPMASPARTVLLAGSVAIVGTALIVGDIQSSAPVPLCYTPAGPPPVPCR